MIYVCLECEVDGDHLWVERTDGQALWIECDCCERLAGPGDVAERSDR